MKTWHQVAALSVMPELSFTPHIKYFPQFAEKYIADERRTELAAGWTDDWEYFNQHEKEVTMRRILNW